MDRNNSNEDLKSWKMEKYSRSKIRAELYIKDGKCFSTFTQGHCSSSYEVAIFEGTLPIPTCMKIQDYFYIELEPLCPRSISKTYYM